MTAPNGSAEWDGDVLSGLVGDRRGSAVLRLRLGSELTRRDR